MGIHIGIEHRTTYRFDRAVQINPQVIRLRPAPHCRTPILAYSLRVTPSEHFVNWQQDPFGNFMARLVFPEPAKVLDVTVDLIADLTVINPFDFFVEESAKAFPFVYEPQLALDLAPYLRPAGPIEPLLQQWLSGDHVPAASTPIADFLVGLNQRLYRDIDYSVRMEPGVQTPDETLARGVGSCRDTGWLLVQVLRHLGLAARFASGYLVQLTSDQPSLSGADGPKTDFTDLHAWAEVYVPGAGWIGLDPTSGLFAGEGHIPLACTPQPSTAAPISGATGRAEVTFEFSNVVHRVHEDPRVTLPYTPEQWARIDALGERGRRRASTPATCASRWAASRRSCRSTTWRAAEWNTAADGEDKRALALDLTLRLRQRFATGGADPARAGQVVPGRAAPPLADRHLWRDDGEPLWRRPDLLADPAKPGTSTIDDAASRRRWHRRPVRHRSRVRCRRLRGPGRPAWRRGPPPGGRSADARRRPDRRRRHRPGRPDRV